MEEQKLGEMETMKKYRKFFAGVCVLVLLLLAGYGLVNARGIADSIWMKSRWNLNFPVMDAEIQYRDFWSGYYVYECSDREEKKVISSLFRQTPTESWISDIVGDLESLNVSSSDFPPFDRIDYCVRKQVRDSKIVILLDSTDHMLYRYSSSG